MKTATYITSAMQATIDTIPGICVDSLVPCIRCDGSGETQPDVLCKRCEGTGIEKHDNPPMETPKVDTEKINEEIEEQLKDAALWFGGFDELRKVIDQLEENANEAAYERFTNDY